MRRPRGNVVLMALFVSIFLFFLSVALVAQNRQDILLALTVDHKLRAEGAARAGLNYGFHVLRTEPDGPSLLQLGSGDDRTVARSEMESGATWELKPLRTHADTNPYLLELRAEGASGFVKATRRMVVEEIRWGRTLPAGSRTYLFATNDDGELVALLPSFQWYALGPTPNSTAPLAAGGGPLFTFAADPGVQVPQDLMDYQPGQGGGAAHLAAVQLRGEVREEKQVTVLQLSGDSQFQFQEDLPLPSDPTGGLVKRTEAATENGQYFGPSYEWYALEGNGLAARGRKVYSHARHYFYRGAQGTEAGEGQVDLQNQGQVFNRPALLALDLDTNAWSVVVDLMVVEDPHTDPRVFDEGPRPDHDTLGLVGTAVYAYETGNDRSVLLAAPENAWTRARTSMGLSHGLYDYQDRLRLHTSDGVLDGWTHFTLEGIPAMTGLTDDVAGEIGHLWNSSTETWQETRIRPDLQVQANMLASLDLSTSYFSGGTNCVAVLGDELYAFVKMRRRFRFSPQLSYLPPFTPEWLAASGDRESLALAHYDGARWQLWPGGLYEFSRRLPPGPKEDVVVVKDSAGKDLKLRASALAVASYPSSSASPPQNRYVPLVTLP